MVYKMVYKNASVLLLLFLLAGCAITGTQPGTSSPGTSSPGTSSAVEKWACHNDLEVSCAKGECVAETGAGFTPMSVNIDESGAISVCAYSGCWEGTGEARRFEDFLVLIVLDRADSVATLKVGGFAHPLLCEAGTED